MMSDFSSFAKGLAILIHVCTISLVIIRRKELDENTMGLVWLLNALSLAIFAFI